MLALYLEQFGISAPPAIVMHAQEESRQWEIERPAEVQSRPQQWSRETLGGVRKLLSDADAGTADLDKAIAELEALEAQIRRLYTKTMNVKREGEIVLARLVRQQDREAAQGIRGDINMSQQWLDAGEIVIPALRDARWQLMAIRAESEDPGDAPAFDNADDLISHLLS